ncbi:MAG: response regulator [Phycisphaerae bacterium]|nr:response regulator [Phycisphaerae bacterium]
MVVARTLEEAHLAIAASTPDLVIADINLPDGKGIDLLPPGLQGSAYPVIVMTSYGDELIAVEAMKAGALDYIVKSKETLENLPHIARRTLRQWEDAIEHKRTCAELESSLREKELLLKEVHHRVKNNLQLISSMLSLQAIQTHNSELTGILEECQIRVRTIALIHEKLYQSENFTQVNFSDYIELLGTELLHAHRTAVGQVDLTLDVVKTYLNISQAIPCGLILNELLTNALKHGFPQGRTGTIHVSFQARGNNQVAMSVSDDGIGIPPDMDLDKQKSLGMVLVKSLVRQLNGFFSLDRQNKTVFTVCFEIDTIQEE